MPTVPDWPRAHGGPVLQGIIRHTADEFAVDERLNFELTGCGEHDFLRIEKASTNTAWLAAELARHAGVPESDVGFAGMKDRNALTRQWFSVRRPRKSATDWSRFERPGVRIVSTERHHRKLRRGAHAGNAFRIVIRTTTATHAGLADRIAAIAEQGVPNYFGEQRFGHEGGNLQLAEALFAGKRLSRGKRSIALSAARAFVFNHILAQRVGDDSWNRLCTGDTACLDGSNSYFVFDALDPELENRCRELDLHPGGALWGRGKPASNGDVLLQEQSVAQEFAALASGLESAMDQSRRALRLAVRKLRHDRSEDQLRLEFELTRQWHSHHE